MSHVARSNILIYFKLLIFQVLILVIAIDIFYLFTYIDSYQFL
jgi:hypothetical protein